MGGVTPNFALRYPYQGEVVSPAHFKNLGDDLDAALTTLDGLRTSALKRPVAEVSSPGTPTAIPQGTATVLALGDGSSSVPFNISGMWSAAQPDRLTCKVAGVYAARSSCIGANGVGVTGINAFELRVEFYNAAGVIQKTFFHKSNTEGRTDPGGWQCNGIWPMQVNDYIRVIGWWGGTGTSLSPYITTQARCVALI